MNITLLKGRIATDIKVNKKDEKSYVNFSIAFAPYIKKDKDDVNFISAVAFNKTAEFIGKYLSKGNLVQVQGVLNERKFKRKDGSNGSKIELLVEHIESLEPKEKAIPDAPNEVVEPVDLPDDDLPF